MGALTLYCGDRRLAEELAQEALARAWADWRRVRRKDYPASWLYRVAINLARSHFRRRAFQNHVQLRLATETETTVENPSIEDALEVRQAVRKLPRRPRTALVLRYYLDLSVREVATIMDCPEGTVKTLTHKAVNLLRQELERTEASNV